MTESLVRTSLHLNELVQLPSAHPQLYADLCLTDQAQVILHIA